MELDSTITQVERLYQTVTGREMPPMDPKRAGIPPERDPVKHVEEQLARLEQALGGLESEPTPGPAWTPRLSLWEADDVLLACVELPGVPRADVRMVLVGQSIVIEGNRAAPRTVSESHAKRVFGEDAWGPFRRIINLPLRVRPDGIEAKLADGLLTIRIKREKSPEEVEKVIPVN